MLLSETAVLFDYHGIPVLGSKVTGDVIGLTPGGLQVCEAMKSEDVAREDVDAVDAQLADALERGGFLAGSAVPAAKPLSAYVHVTQRCNLSCFGCYSDDERRNCLPDAPRESFAVAFRKLADYGAREVILSGGEPFLRDDLWQLCRDAKEAGIDRIAVISNGTCLSEDALVLVAPYVDCVGVSFDGACAEAPAYIRGEQRFDELVRAVRLVQKVGIHAHIIATVHRRNVDDLAAYGELAGELGVSFNFSILSCCEEGPCDPDGILFDEPSLVTLGRAVFDLGSAASSAVMDAPLSLNLSVRRACGAGSTNLSIGTDGTVYPCHMLHYGEMAMGNIFSCDMGEIMRADVACRLAKQDVMAFEACRDCGYAWFCGGGCRARAYAEHKQLDAKDPYCAMTTSFYQALGEHLNASLERVDDGS